MQPTKQIRDGAVQASVFEREAQGRNGTFLSQSIALQIGYKKGDEWQNSKITIIKRNLDKVISVLTQAKEAVASGASSSERCYSDHNEDIRVKGSCDYCGDTELDSTLEDDSIGFDDEVM